MARSVYFSFHYEADVWRAWQVRNSWVAKEQAGEDVGFFDEGLREAVKRKDDRLIRQAIRRGLDRTEVTVVLIGSHTASRYWVQEEIRMSFEKSQPMLGVYIHNIKDRTGETSEKGANPFRHVEVTIPEGLFMDERTVVLAKEYEISTYDWKNKNGRENLEGWIEDAIYDCDW